MNVTLIVKEIFVTFSNNSITVISKTHGMAQLLILIDIFVRRNFRAIATKLMENVSKKAEENKSLY